jgi:PAS domain-containing protein
MERAFAYGASGVQMGTRFACTAEGDAADRFKQAFIDAKEEDVVIIKSPVGIPGRALKTPFVAKYLEGDVTSKPCIANCLAHCSYRNDRSAFCIAQALVDAYRGDYENGLFFCGDNVTKCTSIETVDEIIGNCSGPSRKTKAIRGSPAPPFFFVPESGYNLINICYQVKSFLINTGREGRSVKPGSIPTNPGSKRRRPNCTKLLIEAQEIARMGSWSWDAQSGILSFSSSILTIWTCPAKARTSLDNYHLPRSPGRRGEDGGAARRGPRFGSPVTRSSTGSWGRPGRPCRGPGAIDRDAEGNPVRVYGSLQDISERKSMEEALEHERSLPRRAFRELARRRGHHRRERIVRKTNRPSSAFSVTGRGGRRPPDR